MDNEIILSKAKKRLFERQQKIVHSYLNAKDSNLNISEWRNKISEEMEISTHAVDYTIRPANVKRILAREKVSV